MVKRIAIIAGEASGDLLAARLILALKALNPNLEFEGIAGSEMQAAGCRCLFSAEKLSVMGLFEVLRQLPSLLWIRHQILSHWRANPPDLFIGVDAPDFNLPVAAKLHQYGIPTVHYVSPSIWAWREKRVRKMQGNIDLMLTLFPFEVEFYQRHHINAVFVGHPLADEIVWDGDKQAARQQLGLLEAEQKQKVIALLPGSRRSEIRRLWPYFVQAAEELQALHPEWHFIVPAVNPTARILIERIWQTHAPVVSLQILNGQSRLAMQAADCILLASGTAVLEGMLSGRLMVATYQVSPLTAWVLRTFKLLKVQYVTLPNHLAQECLVPELLQEQVVVEGLVAALESLFMLPQQDHDYRMRRFHELRQQLQQDASASAARTILARFN